MPSVCPHSTIVCVKCCIYYSFTTASNLFDNLEEILPKKCNKLGFETHMYSETTSTNFGYQR